jgi:hypothetical protein
VPHVITINRIGKGSKSGLAVPVITRRSLEPE